MDTRPAKAKTIAKTSVARSRGCAAALCSLSFGAATADVGDQWVGALRGEADLAPPRVSVVQLASDPSSARVGAAALGLAPELVGVSYRWWLTSGRADFGVGVGTLGYRVSGFGALPHEQRSIVGAVPTVTVGWRYRVSGQSVLLADASGAPGFAAGGSDGYFSKVAVEWKPRTEPRFGLDGTSLGVQFDSGMRMSLRLRKGGLGVYLRSKF